MAKNATHRHEYTAHQLQPVVFGSTDRYVPKLVCWVCGRPKPKSAKPQAAGGP